MFTELIYFLFQRLKYETNKVAFRIYLMSEFTQLYLTVMWLVCIMCLFLVVLCVSLEIVAFSGHAHPFFYIFQTFRVF